MRKISFVVGIIVICIGIPLAYYGNTSRELITYLNSAQSEPYASSQTFGYLKGQKLLVGVGQGRGWETFADVSDEFREGGQWISLVAVNVTIIAPNGNSTKLEAEYRVKPNTQDLILYVVKVHHKSDGLTLKTFNTTWTSGSSNFTSEYLYEREEIGGIADLDGNYTATVSLVGPPIPPTRITLYKYSVTTVYDWWFLLPPGLAAVAIGCVVTVWAGRTTSRKTHTKPVK